MSYCVCSLVEAWLSLLKGAKLDSWIQSETSVCGHWAWTLSVDTGPHSPPRCFSGSVENKLSPSVMAVRGNHFPARHSNNNTDTHSHTPGCACMHCWPQIQTCTHIIKYTNMYKHPHTRSRRKTPTTNVQIGDNLRAALTFISTRGSLKKQDRQNVSGLKASCRIAFYSSTVLLTTWTGNPSAHFFFFFFWPASVQNRSFHLSELNLSSGHRSPQRCEWHFHWKHRSQMDVRSSWY